MEAERPQPHTSWLFFQQQSSPASFVFAFCLFLLPL
jgi:hypothetical protein